MTLVDAAKAVMRKVRLTMRKNANPLETPWPPGIDYRSMITGTGETSIQLRPGAKLPGKLYLALEKRARWRASRQSANPCVN